MPARARGTQRASVRFSFALMACALAVLLSFFLDRITGDRIPPFLPAFAGVIISAAWAGAGPGFLAALLLVSWSGLILWREGIAFPSIILRCLIFAVEGVLLSVGSSRMWRSMHDAAESETWHRRLVETAPEGIWVQDDRGVITFANARLADMLGVKFESLTGRNVDEFFFPADLSMERIRAANLRLGRKEQFDRRLRRSDGSEIWVLTCCNLVSVNDQVAGTLAMMTDITERRRAESALRVSEERFRDLFESVLEGVYRCTPDGRIVSANSMLMEMLGLTSATDLSEVRMADFFADDAAYRRRSNQLERDGVLQSAEHDLRRRDGQTITVLENARVVRDPAGGPLFHEGTLTDITPRKRMEEQLREAQKMQALGKLAGSVADDFSNALTVITGSSEIALMELEPGHPARGSIEQALQAAADAKSVTRQMMAFSRSLAPEEGSVNLNAALRDCEAARLYNPVLSLSSGQAAVYATENRIDFLARRLSEGLRRNFPSDRLEWKVRARSLDTDSELVRRGARPGDYAVLSIGRSSGPGSPDSGSENARDTRQPLDCSGLTVLSARESAALGLAETHAAAANCDGFIAVDGARTGFHAFLPSAEEKAVTSAGSRRGRETIMLVEDDPLIRELSRDMLERQGYRVLLASNGMEAERIAAVAGTFDLLIADTAMPDIAGSELARRLRAVHPGLKTLYIAGYADVPGNGQMHLEENAEGIASNILQRPFSADSLGRKIREVLGQERRSAGIQ